MQLRSTQNSVAKIISFDKILKLLLVFGTLATLTNGFVYNHIDEKGSIMKSAGHVSNADLKIVSDYQVIVDCIVQCYILGRKF